MASDKRLETCGAAHFEHLVHAGHARDVPSKRLIEAIATPIIILPGRGEALWIGGGKEGLETMALYTVENIRSMLATLDTSQCVMCPYIASAAFGFAYHSCVAAFKAKLLLKVPGGCGGGCGGEGGGDGGQLWPSTAHESGHKAPQEL